MPTWVRVRVRVRARVRVRVRARVNVADLEQRGDRLLRLDVGGVHEGGLAVLVTHAAVSTREDEELHHLGVAEGGGMHEGGGALLEEGVEALALGVHLGLVHQRLGE